MQQTMPEAQLAAPLHLSAATSPGPGPASSAAAAEQVAPFTHIAFRPFWSMQQTCVAIEQD
jgi:hypothetical protein